MIINHSARWLRQALVTFKIASYITYHHRTPSWSNLDTKTPEGCHHEWLLYDAKSYVCTETLLLLCQMTFIPSKYWLRKTQTQFPLLRCIIIMLTFLYALLISSAVAVCDISRTSYKVLPDVLQTTQHKNCSIVINNPLRYVNRHSELDCWIRHIIRHRKFLQNTTKQ